MIHLVFDLLAAAASFIVTWTVYRWRLAAQVARVEQAGPGYPAALVAGAVIGAYAAGTLNLWLSGQPGLGRSIIGALAGGVAAVEIYKRAKGIRGTTGLVFVPAFATSLAVGRLGCFFAGLEDYTYGTATTLPWGVDFGDGVMRHPVQLYESAAMSAFLLWALLALHRRSPLFMANGFYLLVLWYAVQRFCWEFLKPYGTLLGPFNAFHLVAVGLVVYAVRMMTGTRHARA